MPELPEVEHLRRTLCPRLIGQRVLEVRVWRRDVCTSFRGSPLRTVRPTGHDLLLAARVSALHRHGKQCAVVASDGRAMCVHLGMSGRLEWHAHPPDRHKHEHLRWRLDSGVLTFRDPRRFGGVWTYPTFEIVRDVRWSALGPDALEVTPAALRNSLARTRRAIKSVLLDQGLIAGVGNIYADEALFASRLSPHRAASTLSDAEVSRLVDALRGVLLAAINAGGSTLRDYRDAEGRAGAAQSAHRVYGRAGLPCASCGGLLKAESVAQRTSVWCPKCQPNI